MTQPCESVRAASVGASTGLLSLPNARLLPVPQGLRSWIAAIWCADLAAGQEVHALPDGTADIVSVSDGPGARPMTFATGPLRRYARYRTEGAQRLNGISLQPGAASLLGVQAAELDNAWQPLSELGLAEAAPLLEAGPSDALGALCAFAQARAARARIEPRVALAVHSLRERSGATHVLELAREQRISERTLLRLFDRHLGMAPKHFARIVRFQRVLAHCQSVRVPKFAELALDVGYADQAHLTREVAALGGMTPSALVRSVRR
jgi:AraC-like DNA-binding protein